MNQSLFNQLKQSLRELVRGRPAPTLPTRTVLVKVEKTVNQTEPSPPNQQNQAEEKNLLKNPLPQNEDLIILPSDNPFVLKQFTELHADLMYKYILKRIRKAVKEDMSYITLFQFGDTRKLAQISRTEYETQLNTLMTYFVENENYELAARCRDTLTRHKQNEGRRPS